MHMQQSLSVHTCYEREPRFTRSYQKDFPNQSLFTASQSTEDIFLPHPPAQFISVHCSYRRRVKLNETQIWNIFCISFSQI